MKKKLLSFVAAGVMVMTLALTGGCCHHRMHGNAGCGCQQSCGKGCKDGAPCNQAGAAQAPAGKPCCSQAPADAPKNEFPK